MTEEAKAAQREYKREWNRRKQLTMTEEAKEARREYRRAWQHANQDKVKEYNARYWQKKADQAAAARAQQEGADVRQ